MSEHKPLITVIIPRRPQEPVETTVAALSDNNRVPFEVLVVSGNQPSYQRNRAIEQAQGEYLYFLDNDSVPAPGNLDRIAAFFADHPSAGVLGGPSLTPAGDSAAQKGHGRVLGSFWGTVFIRARYRSFGTLRESSDRELILCNLSIRRAVLEKVGLLNEQLYPNEENELMDRISAAGYRLYHDPQLTVERSQRPTVKQFIRQMTGYGRGRAEQLRMQFSVANLPLFVFMGWPLYLAALPFLVTAWGVWPLLPAALYLAGTVAATLPAFAEGSAVLWHTFSGFLLCHLCYGLGMWRGFSGRLRSSSVEPQAEVRRVKSG